MINSADSILLSPRVRRQVETRVKQCLEIARKHYKRDFEFPTIRYDVKNTHAGLAIANAWTIRLNLILLAENEKHFIEHTVAHEVAHLINRKVNKPAPEKKRLMPHGPEWKAVMALLDVPANRTHNYDCTSIDRSGTKRRRPTKRNLMLKIKLLFNRLELAERHQLLDELNEAL
jgi:predicted SprT family Zn-dependent metalloprotease